VKDMMRTRKPTFDRRALANLAMQSAIATRAKAKLDQHSPVCIYGLCATLGVAVRFNNINMEGMYQRAAPARIHLSARRPLARRAYNCAHELGHHVFGHGSSIDELREDAKEHPWEDPKEFLADTFAGFTLMPIMGLRHAFALRGWTPETATPVQMFAADRIEIWLSQATIAAELESGGRSERTDLDPIVLLIEARTMGEAGINRLSPSGRALLQDRKPAEPGPSGRAL